MKKTVVEPRFVVVSPKEGSACWLRNEVQSVPLAEGLRKKKGAECTLCLRLKKGTSKLPKEGYGFWRTLSSARLTNVRTSAPPAQEEMASFHILEKLIY